MSGQGVYKTTVTCSVGYSIESPDHSWEKSNVTLASEIGPGYPEAELMQVVLRQQLDDATRACEEQIQTIANKIIEQVQVGQ